MDRTEGVNGPGVPPPKPDAALSELELAQKRDSELRERLGLKPETQSMTYKVTDFALRMLQAMISSTIRVDGLHNLTTNGPILFVANHFTRFETFILPYVINRYAARYAHSLAHHSLFRGGFGTYLRTMGAMSTRDPDIKNRIIEDLLTGRNHWIIYPEGSMVKDKKIWEKGKFQIASRDRKGAPHTGAAVMAIQAAMYKDAYLRACKKGEAQTKLDFEQRFHFSGEEGLPKESLSIVPVNITYYPIRPGQNLISKLARFFFKKLPSGVAEELEIEGSLLLKETDISIYFGKPVSLDDYLTPLIPIMRFVTPFFGDERRKDLLLDLMKMRLTTRLMRDIYTKLTVNLDHLFCSGLRALERTQIDCDDFHLAIYLAAREIQSQGHRRSHPSIAGDLSNIVALEPYPPLENIVNLGLSEGVIRKDGNAYLVDPDAVNKTYTFDDIRLKNTLNVIANELEPCREIVKTVATLVNQPRSYLRAKAAKVMEQEDRAEFLEDRAACAAMAHRKDADVGQPFFLHHPQSELGIVLSHGYLSSPLEIRRLAEYLHNLGYSVYGVRLKGHGTVPEQLDHVTWQEWLFSFNRGYSVIRNSCPRVVLGGFSTGGLLALLAASRKPHDLTGCFAINAPLGLVDFKSALVPAVSQWNHLLEKFHIHRGQLHAVKNYPENPDSNYLSNPINGIHQLELLMDATRHQIGKIRKPTLVIQGDEDPVVEPKSGRQIYANLRCEHKELAWMSFRRHCIVRGDGSEQVFERVAEFIRTLKHDTERHRVPTR